MVTARQRPAPVDATREGILDAAAAVFARLGYARVTIADIGREAAVTRPTVYAYFTNKRDVFIALTERVRLDFLGLQQVEYGSAWETAEHAVVEYLGAYTRHFELLSVLAGEAVSDTELRQVRDSIHSRANRRHARFLAAHAAELTPAAPLAVVAEAVTGIVMRFAEEIAADESVRTARAEELVAIYRRLLGQDG